MEARINKDLAGRMIYYAVAFGIAGPLIGVVILTLVTLWGDREVSSFVFFGGIVLAVPWTVPWPSLVGAFAALLPPHTRYMYLIVAFAGAVAGIGILITRFGEGVSSMAQGGVSTALWMLMSAVAAVGSLALVRLSARRRPDASSARSSRA